MKDTRPALRIRSTGLSSLRFGPCEICNQYCADVHTLREPTNGGRYTFGCKPCLLKLAPAAVVLERDAQ